MSTSKINGYSEGIGNQSNVIKEVVICSTGIIKCCQPSESRWERDDWQHVQ
ncbi:MAG: hypothetical protein AAF327_16065 [Cyanobacteria bacterium P01_A01_bin.37]